jgi:hypothetical protein
MIDVFAEEPEVPPEWGLDFASALSRLLTATSALFESTERIHT